MRSKGCSQANRLNRFLAKNDVMMLLNLDANVLCKLKMVSLIAMSEIGETIK